ncbi:Rab5 GDP/GTP exchange factor [Dictyocoela muelleri]|nr:Rab5 GDP/GTP exchange factor [Dictyocoela muelleri]
MFKDIKYKYIFKEIDKMQFMVTPTGKINCIMSCCKKIYDYIGHDSGNDDILTFFIYVLVKGKFMNLYLNFIFMKKYLMNFNLACQKNCTHLNVTEIRKCCFKGNISFSEMEYYLTLFESALKFIERMEYNTLKITREEFDRNISNLRIFKPKCKEIGFVDKARNKILKKINFLIDSISKMRNKKDKSGKE